MFETLLMKRSVSQVEILGPQTLAIGDSQLGYYGRFTDADLTGSSLASMVGYTEGALANDLTEWFKFAYQGKILITPVKCIRYGVTWAGLYAKGLVYGTNDNGKYPSGSLTNQYVTVNIKGQLYKVRLFMGADADPAPTTLYNVTNPVGSRNSEYTQLIDRVFSSGTLSPRFESLTNEQLGMVEGTANILIRCQEKHGYFSDGTGRVQRGYRGALDFGASVYNLNENDTVYKIAWKPVLELIA